MISNKALSENIISSAIFVGEYELTRSNMPEETFMRITKDNLTMQVAEHIAHKKTKVTFDTHSRTFEVRLEVVVLTLQELASIVQKEMSALTQTSAPSLNNLHFR